VTELPIKTKPPFNLSVLERWLTEASRSTGQTAGRMRRWLGFMVLAAMLDSPRRDSGDEPLFLVKGGVSMELRAGTGARATKDFDAAFRDPIEALADRLDEALAGGHGDFTASRSALQPIANTRAVRCDVKLAYRGRSMITIKMEIAPTEGGMREDIDLVVAKSFDYIGIAGPEVVPCVALRWQIAQKLHACTETFAGGENGRFRDLLDLQILSELVVVDTWPAVREACAEVFTLRANHTWPPELTVPDSWVAGYNLMAKEAEFPVADVSRAADAVRDLIVRIDQA
jgi:Nucleotidyl transferase AbiEii toxin, Type IV TA system